MVGQGKVCTKQNCKKEKPLQEFGLNKGKNDGHESWCKECVSKHKKKNYALKKKKLKLLKARKQTCQSTVIGNLSEETINNFCQIFGEICRGFSYAD
jgi:hypothetical protein